MRALVFNSSDLEYLDSYPMPKLAAGESLIQVELAAICNTDREILRGYRPDFCGVLGHEFVGIVRESSQSELVGKRVVGEINISCGKCLYCMSNRPNHCSERLTLGINKRDGAFADYLSLPSNLLHVVSSSIPPEQAVFCEPLAAALRITEQVEFGGGMPVAIIGDGRLALMICQVIAATTEAEIHVIGHHPQKLEQFAQYATTHEQVEGSYEVVIDASGSPGSLSSAIACTRSLGILVMKSTYAGDTAIDMSEIVVRELRIQGSRCGPFEPALQLLANKKVDLPTVELFSPKDYKAAFDSRAFKAAFDFRS